MQNQIIITLILWSFAILIVKLYFYNIDDNFKSNGLNEQISQNKSKCWISSTQFPEAQKIFDSRNIILKELMNILDSDKWGIWSSDYSSTPIFTQMTDGEIMTRIKSNSGKINSAKEPSWRLFGLILNNKKLPTAELCPNTINLLESNSSRVLNAGFSLLEPKSYIGEHRDFNKKFYRLHIPLIIPKINNSITESFIDKSQSDKLCVLQVENDYRIWKDNEYFIFDDTCLHNAWNNTQEIRIVLLVDLLKD